MFQPHIQEEGAELRELQRLRALYQYELIGEPPDPEYDAIVQMAAALCEVPIVLMSLVDQERLWFKAAVGLPGVTSTERAGSFCEHVIQQDGLFLLEDAQTDERFRDHPMVRGQPHIRFYAGVPLRAEDGSRIGALCIIDHVPRSLSGLQQQALTHLGRQIETHLRLRLQLRETQAHITERKRVESALRAQQEVLTQVLAHVPHSVFWKDRDGVFLGCNNAFSRQLGQSSPSQIIGRTDHDFGFPADQIQAYRRDDLQVTESGVPKLGIEEPVRGEGGEERWVLTSKVPLKDADGSVQGVLGIFADITERRRQETTLHEALKQVRQHAAHLEAQVREARERIRRLMESSLDAVFVLDEEGVVLEANPVAERLLGFDSERLLGVPFESLAPEPERARLRQALGELLAQGAMHLEERELRAAAGRSVPLQLTGAIHEAGASRRLLIVAHDLTEQRRLEHQSIQHDRLAALGVLAAGIAHEINNPTAYVLSNLEFLRRWRDELDLQLAALPEVPPEVALTLSEASIVIGDCLEGASRIQDIVRGMRYLAYQGPIEALESLDVHDSLESVLHLAQGELKHTARLEKDYGTDLPRVLGSEGRLGQVFLNLIINAVHAMKPGTPNEHALRVSTRLDQGRVRIDISDTGHGIDPEVMPRIFDPFFTTKPAGIGTGLGLSISHAIVQKMGGEMLVESQPGRGTTFSLLLPTSDI